MRTRRSARSLAVLAVIPVLAGVLTVSAAAAPEDAAFAVGSGGGVASVDVDATRVGLDVLAHGGTAADAAVATAAALGVTEPYSAGVGGGGFFVHYSAGIR